MHTCGIFSGINLFEISGIGVQLSLSCDYKDYSMYSSFDEHAQKDLPAMIDYVLKVTNQSDLFYVGHSQGTIMGFAGFTFNQTLASHIKIFFAFAPVVNVTNIKGAISILAVYSNEVAVCSY